jgi:ABC-type phosphate/phosphonate transport system ATPase subunit
MLEMKGSIIHIINQLIKPWCSRIDINRHETTEVTPRNASMQNYTAYHMTQSRLISGSSVLSRLCSDDTMPVALTLSTLNSPYCS